MMRGGTRSLVSLLVLLLTLASLQGSSWCAAETTTSDRHHHPQVQEFHGRKNLEEEIHQSPGRKLGHGRQSFTEHEVMSAGAVDMMKHARRIAIGHKGGGGSASAAAAGGGGGTVVRPHKTKNGAAALAAPVPVAASVLLALATGLALSVLGF